MNILKSQNYSMSLAGGITNEKLLFCQNGNWHEILLLSSKASVKAKKIKLIQIKTISVVFVGTW